jgi:hypothetical protein
VRGTWKGDTLTGDPEGYVEEGSGNRHLSLLGPCWRTRRRDHWLGTFRDRLRLAQEICKKKALAADNSIHRGPTGEPWGEGSCTRDFEIIFGLLFLDPENVRSLSLGAIWNFSKGLGFPMTWHQIMGQKEPVWRSRCIGTKRAQTQLLLYPTHPVLAFFSFLEMF